MAENMSMILTIVGAFGTVTMAINAFFLKGIYSELGIVKVALAVSIENSKAKERRLDHIENYYHDIAKKVTDLEKRMV